MEESQTSRFLTYFREKLKVEQPVTPAEMKLGQDDLALVEQFIEHLDKAEQGRAEREAVLCLLGDLSSVIALGMGAGR